MNWDAITAVAETLGLIGLIVSVIYLGVQVRHGNAVSEDSSLQGVLSLVHATMRDMNEAQNREIVMAGLLDYETLRSGDKLVFDNLMFGMFSPLEGMLLGSNMDLLHSQHPEGAGYYLKTRVLVYDGALSWWSESKDIFLIEFQEWMEGLIRDVDETSDFFRIKGDS